MPPAPMLAPNGIVDRRGDGPRVALGKHATGHDHVAVSREQRVPDPDPGRVDNAIRREKDDVMTRAGVPR